MAEATVPEIINRKAAELIKFLMNMRQLDPSRSSSCLLSSFEDNLAKQITAKVSNMCSCRRWEAFTFNVKHSGITPIEEIVARGQCDHVAFANDVHIIGFHPLHIAAGVGNLAAMKHIVEKGGDIYAYTKSQNLHAFNVALMNKQYDACIFLIHCGYKFPDEDAAKKSLSSCICLGQLTGVKMCLQTGINMTTELWRVCMLKALEFSHTDIVDWLLDLGVGGPNDVLCQSDGRTSLHIAQTTKMTELLLNKGADPTICGPQCGTALTTQVMRERLDICEIILTAVPSVINITSSKDAHYSYYGPLHMASWEGNIAAVNLLLEYGADPHLPTYDGNTALSLACHSDSLACVERLLNLNCDPNKADKDGDTALLYATYNGNLQICELLLKNGANPNVQNRANVTPLWNSVYSRSLGMVKNLLSLNVRPDICCKGINIYDDLGYIYDEPVSPLFVALHHEDISISKALVSAGCFLNKQLVLEPHFSMYICHWANDNKRWLQHNSHNPPSLAWWCKRTIRSNLPINPKQAVDSFNVAKSIKSYLLEV